MGVILAVFGTGVYYYIHRETKLSFHSCWEESDRRQMQEIVDYMNKAQKEQANGKKEQFRELVDSFSLDNWKEWPTLCGGIYDYCMQDFGRGEFAQLGDIVAQTAGSGNVAYQGKSNYTLLDLSFALSKWELAGHLLDKGANVHMKFVSKDDRKTLTEEGPINWLAGGGMDSSRFPDADMTISLMEKLAARGANLNVRVRGRLSPFEMFCIGIGSRYGFEDKERVILRLIDLAPDVSMPLEYDNGNRRSAFAFPVKHGLSKVVLRLCEMGVDVNEGYDALPPVFCISLSTKTRNQVEIVRILFDHGARINGTLLPSNKSREGKDGQTFLAYMSSAISHHYEYEEKQKRRLLELFTLCLERKADVNEPSAEGMTPLMYLFKGIHNETNREMRLKLARALLDHGADPCLKNNKGKTVMDLIGKYPGRKAIWEELPELQTEE